MGVAAKATDLTERTSARAPTSKMFPIFKRGDSAIDGKEDEGTQGEAEEENGANYDDKLMQKKQLSASIGDFVAVKPERQSRAWVGDAVSVSSVRTSASSVEAHRGTAAGSGTSSVDDESVSSSSEWERSGSNGCRL